MMKHAKTVLLFCLALILLASCGGRTKEDVEKAIRGSAGMQRVDYLCNELPEPAGFEFLYKDVGGNTFKYGISYQYKTAKPHDEIKKFYLNWFSANGWLVQKNEAFTFRKNNQMITVGRVGGAVTKNGDVRTIYSIYCTEEH